MDFHSFYNGFNPFWTGNPLTGTLSNSEDPDEMLHNAAFHLGLHYLVRQSQSSKKEMQYFLAVIIYDPSVYIKDHPDFVVCSFMEFSICLKRVKKQCTLQVFPLHSLTTSAFFAIRAGKGLEHSETSFSLATIVSQQSNAPW